METMQLECGNCRQLMAIAVEYLGGQVRCPHCQSVVQTPAPTPPPAPVPNLTLDHPESIFAAQDASESVLGESSPPKVDLQQPGGEAPPESTPSGANDFTQFKRRPVYTSSVMQLIALIFLVPYAIVMTAFVIYLVFVQGAQQRYDPLEILRDPVPDPKKGGAKQVSYLRASHTHPLAANLKTTLGKPIRLGDIVVTFERVRLTEDGDLKLFLRAKNVSTKCSFEPMHDLFVNPKKSPNPLYTYLETNAQKVERVYGAYLAYHKNADGEDDQRGSAILGPREETFVALTTTPDYHKHIKAIIEGKDACVWRVQVRRGFVKVDDRDVSATGVVGVEFTPADIERKAQG